MESDKVKIGLLPFLVSGRSGRTIVPGRASHVLSSMLRLKYIDQEQFDAASTALLDFKFERLKHLINAPHFSLWMRSEIEELLASLYARNDWEAAGITIRTTLDPALQKHAKNVVDQFKDTIRLAGAKNVALVAVDRHTRQVLAYIGNVDFFMSEDEGQIDMAKAPRQPGSSFKPLVYSAAFERGFTPDSIVVDEPIHIGNDVPKNYEGGFRGAMTIREALARSRNIPAIKVFLEIGGEEPVLELGQKAGIRTPYGYKLAMQQTDQGFSYGWPLAIGSTEVPLTEMVELYATIANRGAFQPLKVLCEIENRNGDTMMALPNGQKVQAIEEQAATWVDEILTDSSSRPDGFWRTMLTIPGIETAAKTGTSNICFQRDVFGRCTEYGVNNVWTMGYTDDLVVGVWVGNADNAPLDPLADGLTVAAPIWRAFLERGVELYKPASKERC